VIAYRAAGQRKRVTVSDESDALTRAEKIVKDLAAGRVTLTDLSTEEAEVYRAALKAIAPTGKRLLAVVEDYMRTWSPNTREATVQTVCDEYRAICQSKSDKYQRDMKFRLAAFCEDFGKRQIAEVTLDEVRAWIESRTFIRGGKTQRISSEKTKANWAGMLSAVWNHAVATKAARENVPLELEYNGSGAGAFSLLAAADLQKLVDELKVAGSHSSANGIVPSGPWARSDFLRVGSAKDGKRYSGEYATTLLPFTAIMAFAGVRTEEAKRLCWENIAVENGVPRSIEIDAGKAKKRERRVVDVCPELVPFLYPFTVGFPVKMFPGGQAANGQFRLSGPIVPYKKADAIVRKIARRIGIKWTHNCLRHSCATHMYRVTKRADHVAEQLGTSAAMLKAHYLERSTGAEAAAWFGVRCGWEHWSAVPPARKMVATKDNKLTRQLAKLRRGMLRT